MGSDRSKRLSPRKVLVASLGVASLSYVVACERQQVTSGNLMARPPDQVDAAPATPQSARPVHTLVSGNLMPPEPPEDAGAPPPPPPGPSAPPKKPVR